MASIKQLSDRKYKITISNGYRTDGRKICKAKTIQVPDSVPKRGVEQYVYHEAERLERLFKQGYSEDAEMTFETYARGWLERQTKYAPGTIAFYRRSLETVFPEIGAIKLNRLRPIALENLLAKLRKRTYRGKPIKENEELKADKGILTKLQIFLQKTAEKFSGMEHSAEEASKSLCVSFEERKSVKSDLKRLKAESKAKDASKITEQTR